MAKASPEKISAAKSAVLEALRAVEVAFADFRAQIGIQPVSVVESDAYKQQLVLRVQTLSLALQRIDGMVRRLAKRLDVDPSEAIGKSQAIRVNERLANTWKHGLGGQAKNATIVNGILKVHRADGFRTASGEERVHVLGMLVVDAGEGSFGSKDLFDNCVRNWASLLEPLLPETKPWGERVAPSPNSPTVTITGLASVVPLGSVVKIPIPADLDATLRADAKKRSASA